MGFALRYATPNKGAPPGIEPSSFVGLGGSLPGWVFAVEAKGSLSVGVASGCEIPGGDDDRVGGGVLGFVAEGGGCESGTDGVAGTVATERESEGGDGWRVDGRRRRRVRRHEVQSMTVTAGGRSQKMRLQCCCSYGGFLWRK